VVALFRYFAGSERNAPSHRVLSAEEILAQRYARGEINADEYQHRLAVLHGSARRDATESQPPSAG
jgi:uncharacterized membrane protein